ncbi:hypothetical protein GYH30_004613 [Glycine max]|nr:hypothetical protein GYH30_004613 [Glycine max]
MRYGGAKWSGSTSTRSWDSTWMCARPGSPMSSPAKWSPTSTPPSAPWRSLRRAPLRTPIKGEWWGITGLETLLVRLLRSSRANGGALRLFDFRAKICASSKANRVDWKRKVSHGKGHHRSKAQWKGSERSRSSTPLLCQA